MTKAQQRRDEEQRRNAEAKAQIDSGYLHSVLHPVLLTSKIKALVKKIKELQADFDAIAITGMSGSLIATPLSLSIKKPVLLIRKPNDTSHGRPTEGYLKARKVIVVDDLISSGETMHRVIGQLDKKNIECVGIFLYNDNLETCFKSNNKEYAVFCV